MAAPIPRELPVTSAFLSLSSIVSPLVLTIVFVSFCGRTLLDVNNKRLKEVPKFKSA
jgi:hypothetical protein